MIYLSELFGGVIKKTALQKPKFQKNYDVIVCGLGTAGSLAALFCAQNGLSVLGIEAFTCVGGTHTAGGISGHYFGCPGGRYEELDQKALDFAKEFTCTPAEARKLLYGNALAESGAELLFEASVCGVYMNENTVTGVRALSKGKILEFGAKIVLDCTAEAAVAEMAGCKTVFGRESDGQMQPYSLVSLWYDGEKYRCNNVDFGRVNQNDPIALSEAILFARSYNCDEAKKGTLICQMPFLGLREGRRIVAEESVRLEDLLADRQTKEPMFYSYGDLDKHGWDIAFDGELLSDWAVGANLGAYNLSIAIPYKAILPKDIEGLLVPCRALGVDRDVSSCVRMNLDMKKAAETAAEWATLAVVQNKALRQIPYAQIREKLLQSGCLKESDNRGVRIDGRWNWDGSPLIPRDVKWITEPSLLKEVLQTEKPGEGIWSAKRIGETAVPKLKQYLNCEDENLKKHAAFALASIGSVACKLLLREMVKQRDPFMLKDCRKHNNLRGCIAIYWLGRLGDREIADELIGLIRDPEEPLKAVYQQSQVQTTRYKVLDFQDIYFQFVSQAVAALVRIGDTNPDLRSRIRKAFEEAFSGDEYYARITKKPRESSEGNVVLSMKNYALSAAERWSKA